MKLFARLFPKKHDNRTPDSVDGQLELFTRLLAVQLQMLEQQLGEVLPSGSYISKRSRGYIYGMMAATLGLTDDNLDSDLVGAMMGVAFEIVWGQPDGLRFYQMTLAECANRDGETLAGAYRAESDVRDVFDQKPYAGVMGFWLLNNGINSEEDLMPTIVNATPLPPV